MEAEAASLEAMQYYHTVRAASGSTGRETRILFQTAPDTGVSSNTGGAPSCDFLTCGHHAVCKPDTEEN